MTKEERYFDLVQQTAKKHDSMFFMDSGEGNEIIDEFYDGEDFSGWLIPLNLAKTFMDVWKGDKEKEDSRWEEYYVIAEWQKDATGKIIIKFK